MFGYVRPVMSRLDSDGKAAYKSAYCGLCHAMGRRHGLIARFTLNYDFAFLALLHYGVGKCTETTCQRCPAHPFRKPQQCLSGEALELAADQSMILTWYKLSDDVADHSFFWGLSARCLRRMLTAGYRRAAEARPAFDAAVCENLEQLNKLEAERSPKLDRVADTFAAILRTASGACEQDPDAQRAMAQILYHLGRWIYLIDAWDDLEDDLKSSRYNPLDARFGGNAVQEREYVETTMTHSLRLIYSAVNLLDFGCWQQVIENILYHGLPMVQHAVLEGKWKELKKQGRTLHERSV